ncbi:restriction endonuclease [Streptomyces sp. NBC_01571]|uniref:restriction endonuclease n=1 Tax=Streptomyces sp. NBC_01571 TaxID=2975883 RepID=UPI002251AB0F|nr:restriction endonuclease [Streptomyces sp. NBC_01571]MCX4581426.1 restriction endonuclease [Streptomyces sp. NBC_01571]
MTRRPPARRPARRPSRRRKQQQDTQLVAAGVAAAAAIGLVVVVVNWLLAHWWILLAALLLGALAAGGWWQQRQQRLEWERVKQRALRYAISQLDALTHQQFEVAVRDLMRRDGCSDALRVGGRGDLGADVKATDPHGRRWVIQCKHRRSGNEGAAVGTPDLQVLNGTGRPVHKADVVVLVTNGRITQPGRDFARQQRLHLVDRQVLAQWATGSRPLWELLPLIPPPRRPTALS